MKNKIGLKGPLATPIGKGHRSLNLEIRKYTNIRKLFFETDDLSLTFCPDFTEYFRFTLMSGHVDQLKVIKHCTIMSILLPFERTLKANTVASSMKYIYLNRNQLIFC